jgi:GNAT superfamily N-acetyltransferase
VNVSGKPVSNAAEADDLRLLRVDIDTMFVMSASGRIERENDPDCSSGPRLFFAGCPFGNIARVRYDVDDRVAQSVLELAEKAPPWRDPDTLPAGWEKIVELLSCGQPAETVVAHPIYKLPNGLRHDHPAPIVRGDSPEGHAMLAGLAERGMPEYMVDAGFKDTRDFWEPWCIAVDGAEIASIAFAARLGAIGAEIGVYTLPKYRGRGFAAAVTASWASLESLRQRALFYSTAKTNRSSQRVAARLGLRRIGSSVRIAS